MTNPNLPRSSLLMNRDDSALLIVDMQERLLPHIQSHEKIVWNTVRLITGAKTLGVPVWATEQYPKGLGHTAPAVRELLDDGPPEKSMFSCRECSVLVDQLRANNISNLVVAGIETHVCVQQTALDFLSFGFNIFLPVDAVGSRFEIDRSTAVRRMENSGIVPTTVEATLFEWCEQAGTPEFKLISKLVQEAFEAK